MDSCLHTRPPPLSCQHPQRHRRDVFLSLSQHDPTQQVPPRHPPLRQAPVFQGSDFGQSRVATL
ncbi:hypothetical protein E2C01_046622 [Portunus trituberculatus]|uniref:Uncharacterized protein n=1 Tax=Portunus trituberculatus TaxID=210409 RepID=A0A5B7G5K9_PORTR|nr:hypothetical protein [Portunus trituberculatus]